MEKINPNNLSPDLFKETVKKSKDGKIDVKEMNDLIKIAEKNGINKDETNFLTALLDESNVEALKEGKSAKFVDFDKEAPKFPDFIKGVSNSLKKAADNPVFGKLASGTAKVLDSIDNQLIKYTDSLSTERKEKFINSFKSIDDNKKTQVMDLINNLPYESQPNIQKLVTDGTLMKKDAVGKTILDNIGDMMRGPNQPGVDGKKLASEALAALADRKNITQGAHYTCGAGSIENYLQKHDPAEMIRIVKDIARDGKCELRDKSFIKAGTGSLNFHSGDKLTKENKNGEYDTEDRSDFDIIFQSAVMRDIAFVGGDRSNSIIDKSDYNVKKDTDGVTHFLGGNAGGDYELISKLLTAVTGKKSSYETCFRSGTETPSFNKLKSSLASGEEPIALYKAGKHSWDLHYVVVTKIDEKEGKVYYHNTNYEKTRGSQEDYQTIDEFKKKLSAIVIP